jgi:nitrogenase subunit NifH
MSGFVCPHCGETVDVFGRGGGERAAGEMQVEYLGAVPLDPELMRAEDEGRSFLDTQEAGATAEALRSLAVSIEKQVQTARS